MVGALADHTSRENILLCKTPDRLQTQKERLERIAYGILIKREGENGKEAIMKL